MAAEEDGSGADGGGGDGGVADVAAVHGVVWRATRGYFAGGAAEEDLVDVGKDGIGADAAEGGEAEGVVGTALGGEAMQVGGGLLCVAGIEFSPRLHRPRAGRCARDPSKRRRRSRAAAGLGVGVHETGLSSTLTENI